MPASTAVVVPERAEAPHGAGTAGPESRTAAIRSYVRRQGRITGGQLRALETHWSRFGVETAAQIDLDRLFERRAPRILEVGFGDGESLAAMAHASPREDFLGVEVHRPGIGHLLLRAAELDLTNLRVIAADILPLMENGIPDHALDRIQVFFPDPWPKKRHHKRRLVQARFVGLAARKLRAGGVLHLATDWEEYACQMLEVIGACNSFSNAAGNGQYAPRPVYRPETRFERRGQRLGHAVRDLLFVRR